MATYKTATKEAILTNIETAINTIAGIQFVDWQRIYDQGIDKTRCPGCYINDIRTDKTKLLRDITKNEFLVGIVGFVWADEGESLGTVLNTFMEAIKDAVILDRSRNGNAYTTNIEVIETDMGSRHPQGTFAMKLNVIFFSVE